VPSDKADSHDYICIFIQVISNPIIPSRNQSPTYCQIGKMGSSLFYCALCTTMISLFTAREIKVSGLNSGCLRTSTRCSRIRYKIAGFSGSTLSSAYVCIKIQGGSNMTGTDLCVNKPHLSRSYLNHLV
jgi:hypothetical protein